MKYISWIILFVFACMLLSCNVEKQAAKKVSWLLAHDLMDDNCSRLYPVRDSIVVKDSVKLDTFYTDPVYYVDTVNCNKKDSIIYRSIKCPPSQVITKVVTHDSIIYKRQTSEEDRLKSEIMQKDRTIADKDSIISAKDKKIDKNNWWKIACIITWASIVVYGVLKIKKVV